MTPTDDERLVTAAWRVVRESSREGIRLDYIALALQCAVNRAAAALFALLEVELVQHSVDVRGGRSRSVWRQARPRLDENERLREAAAMLGRGRVPRPRPTTLGG